MSETIDIESRKILKQKEQRVFEIFLRQWFLALLALKSSHLLYFAKRVIRLNVDSYLIPV